MNHKIIRDTLPTECGEYLARWMEYFEQRFLYMEETLDKLSKNHREVVHELIEKDFDKLKSLKFKTVNFDKSFDEFKELLTRIQNEKEMIIGLIRGLNDVISSE